MTVSASTGPARSPASATATPRRLAVAWQHPDKRSIQPAGFLSDLGTGYEFRYIRNARDLPGFVPFFGFSDLDKRYASARLFPLFAQRVMDPRRPDYVRFVQTLDLSPEATPWEQLTRSEGRRSGDTIVLFPEPVVGADGASCCNFFVHGIRHMLSQRPELDDVLAGLRRDDPLTAIPEPENPVNPEALLVAEARSRTALGWVPDVLLDYARAILDSGGYRFSARQINGHDVPSYQRLLVRLEGTVPPGFEVFSGPRWMPLS